MEWVRPPSIRRIEEANTPGFTQPQVAPIFATEATGAAGGVDEYGGASGPLSFGPEVFTNATTGTGDLVGVQMLSGEPTGFVFVPTGYPRARQAAWVCGAVKKGSGGSRWQSEVMRRSPPSARGGSGWRSCHAPSPPSR